MLKIILFLATFAVAVWLPIVIYIVLDNNKPAKLMPEAKIAASVAHRQFGKGSNVSFDRYLERKSTVEVKSVRDMCEWLLGCEYMPDQEFFNQSDLWQHPVDFETTRKGDCEDHSLWAW